MAAKEAITNTIKRLHQTKVNYIPVIVDTVHKCIKSLIKTLENNNVLVVIKHYKNSCAVRLTKNIKTIEVLQKFVHTKNNQIPKWAEKMLANKEGHLLITTSRGIVTHREATEQRLGGQIIGFVY